MYSLIYTWVGVGISYLGLEQMGMLVLNTFEALVNGGELFSKMQYYVRVRKLVTGNQFVFLRSKFIIAQIQSITLLKFFVIIKIHIAKIQCQLYFYNYKKQPK
eukprot:TRINITY_DN8182_c0_g1_i2.p4 TRINITY_DN8182_c0_g1~~TRINITY_DN8182_c0_g1_i2.p4  ORF type:complete len:103 (+),score=0.67 TRINITY_DN8182_c0_g1_i2:181-489(+)